MHSLNIDRFIAVNCYRSSCPLLWAEELTAIRRKVNCYQKGTFNDYHPCSQVQTIKLRLYRDADSTALIETTHYKNNIESE